METTDECAFGPCKARFKPRTNKRFCSHKCGVKASHAKLFIRQSAPTAKPVDDHLTQLQRVCGLLVGRWLAAYEVQAEIYKLTGKRVSESAVTARIRELRTVRAGCYNVLSRPVAGKNHREYTVAK